MEIQRYDMIGMTLGGEAWQELKQYPEGDWMRYEDYAALLASHEELVWALLK
jgi:O6-methylguanine-DNA--protein-cysteine methyltransferase